MRPEESFLGNPVRSLQTMLRTISLYNNSVPLLVPDGIFGSLSANAVRVFLLNNGMNPTGVADKETWDSIYSQYQKANIEQSQASPIVISMDPNEVLSNYTGSPYLYLAQAMLTFLSKLHTNVAKPGFTGTNDAATAESIASFQRLHGLDPTGTINKATWAALTNQFSLNADLERVQNS